MLPQAYLLSFTDPFTLCLQDRTLAIQAPAKTAERVHAQPMQTGRLSPHSAAAQETLPAAVSASE
jgi:hypothetical protein